MKKLAVRLTVLAFLLMSAGQAQAWLDKTHIAVAKAGYEY